jgi:hypothetical protein
MSSAPFRLTPLDEPCPKRTFSGQARQTLWNRHAPPADNMFIHNFWG